MYRRARFAIVLEQPHRTAVAVHAFKPVDTGNALGNAHRVSFDNSLSLDGGAFLGSVTPQFREDDRDIYLGRVRGGQHFASGGYDAHEDRLRPDTIKHAAQHFIRMQCKVVEMVLGTGLDRLVEIVQVNGFGRQSHETRRIRCLGGVVRGHHNFGVVRCRRIARAVRWFIPHFPVADSPVGVLHALPDICGPGGKIMQRECFGLVLLVPLPLSIQQGKEFNVIAGRVAQIAVQFVPRPLPFLGFHIPEAGAAGPHVRDADLDHLWKPIRHIP